MRVLAVGAHPDDLEILCGGTLARFVREGHEVVMCHASRGDRGSYVHTSEELARIRGEEARRAAEICGAEYATLGLSDGEISAADREQQRLVVDLVREARPDLIITHYPHDYMGDHNEISRLVFDCSFYATLPLYETGKPTLAMINGYCMGGGVSLAMSADLRIASDKSRFAVPAAKLGVGYRAHGIRKLMSVVNPAYVKEIFYTARQFSAEEALAMGWVNRVLPEEQLEGYVREYAGTIAANAPLTLRAVKATVNELLKDSDARDLAWSEGLVAACFTSEDYVEGRRAFMEKRKPQFKGR